MAKAISRTNRGRGFLAGTFQLGRHGDGLGSVKQNVSDGDTVNVSSAGNFAIRFLGIDTPEKSITAPGTTTFTSTDKQVFVDLLADPFPDSDSATGFSAALVAHLRAQASATAAANHHKLGEDAEDALEAMISDDMTELGQTKDDVSFFLAFAFEALDFFGRLLAYVHIDQAGVPPDQRKPSYNERMLASGLAAPYFIFPNVDPFRARGSVIDAAFDAQSPQNILQKAPKLREARKAVKAARAAGTGIYDPADPLQFDAFELRFLAKGKPPSRWLINLSGDDRVLFHPQTYPDIPNAEDRLWVPASFVPLFENAGWSRGPVPGDFA